MQLSLSIYQSADPRRARVGTAREEQQRAVVLEVLARLIAKRRAGGATGAGGTRR